MSKKYSILITALFCLFIFGFGIAQFVVADKEFSQQENRFLAGFKAPTWATLKSGEFMESFEDYITDQFPLRDKWIQIKAWCEKTIGKKENNGVYLGKDKNTLFAQYTTPSQEDFEKKVGYVNKLGANAGVPVYFALIPDKSYVWADLLPNNAPLTDDGTALQIAGSLCSGNVTWIDLSQALSGDEVFYRTDHHWTTMGAYQGYKALMQAMNGSYTTLDPKDLTEVSDEFYGTTYSSSGAGWVSPDKIYTWIEEGTFDVTWYHDGTPKPGKLYDTSKLEVKDKYSMFLGGNQPLCIIKNEQADGGKLLVIRDSYGDTLAPFLGLDYSEVHMWDLRYNRMSLRGYIAQNGITQVLVIYSNSNFATDTNLPMLGM
ncbi:MAG: hypothetical protein IKT81_02225 [Clostridia bacterium]|nr:hypothetical protein [Clostridia bacterium]